MLNSFNAEHLSSKEIINIAKGTTDPRVEPILKVQTKIMIEFHLQKLDQTSTSKSQPNINLTKHKT